MLTLVTIWKNKISTPNFSCLKITIIFHKYSFIQAKYPHDLQIFSSFIILFFNSSDKIDCHKVWSHNQTGDMNAKCRRKFIRSLSQKLENNFLSVNNKPFPINNYLKDKWIKTHSKDKEWPDEFKMS